MTALKLLLSDSELGSELPPSELPEFSMHARLLKITSQYSGGWAVAKAYLLFDLALLTQGDLLQIALLINFNWILVKDFFFRQSIDLTIKSGLLDFIIYK